MKSAFILLCFFILMISCNKSSLPQTNEVWIRIENGTGGSINDIKIGDVQYSNLNDQNRSGYKLISFPIYAAYCNFKVNGQDASAGYLVCGTPMPPPFEPGYYTFKIGSISSPKIYSLEVEKR